MGFFKKMFYAVQKSVKILYDRNHFRSDIYSLIIQKPFENGKLNEMSVLNKN